MSEMEEKKWQVNSSGHAHAPYRLLGLTEQWSVISLFVVIFLLDFFMLKPCKMVDFIGLPFADRESLSIEKSPAASIASAIFPWHVSQQNGHGRLSPRHGETAVSGAADGGTRD
jgi:hypothetical protein